MLKVLIKYILLLMVILSLPACTLGPRFKTPQTPSMTSLKAGQEAKAQPGAQQLIEGKQITSRWWEDFKCPKLNQVVEMAIEANPNLTSLKETLHQAYEEINVRKGMRNSPQVWATVDVSEQRESIVTPGNKKAKAIRYDSEHLLLNTSYNVDIFGQGRKRLEASIAKMNYQRFQLEAGYLNLTAGVVATVGKEMAIREQIKINQEIIQTLTEQLNLLQKQFDLGASSKLDILSQQTQIEQIKANLPPLDKELAYTRHQLAIYLGKLPQEEAQLPSFTLQEITLPMELPLSLPSSFVRQRPDIRAYEELLHIASANIGIAQIDLYPSFTLTGSYGTEANKIIDLFRPERMIGNVAAGMTQPVFGGGVLQAKYRASKSAYNQALAEYQQTVLSAFQNIADILQALQSDGELINAQMATMQSAQETYTLAKTQYESGAANYIQILNAQKDFIQSKKGFVQAQATRFADTTALYQALGGGWWNRKEENL